MGSPKWAFLGLLKVKMSEIRHLETRQIIEISQRKVTDFDEIRYTKAF